MKKRLLLALCAFACGSACVLAQSPATEPISSDIALIPLSSLDTEQIKAARAAAAAKWDAMTPKERLAAKAALNAKPESTFTAFDEEALRSTVAPYEVVFFGGPNFTGQQVRNHCVALCNYNELNFRAVSLRVLSGQWTLCSGFISKATARYSQRVTTRTQQTSFHPSSTRGSDR